MAAGNARYTRGRLLPLLQEAAKLQDIDLLLEIEKAFLTQELEHLSEAPLKASSLGKAIAELEAAVAMLAQVRNPGFYRELDESFSLDKNRKNGYPYDQAQQFFESHKTRLSNIERGRLEKSERDLLAAREGNLKTARNLYTELQEQALANADIREPAVRYVSNWGFTRLLADCA